MKVALMRPQLLIGGAEIDMRELAILLKKAGHSVTMYTQQLHGPLLRKYLKYNIPIFPYPPISQELNDNYDLVIVMCPEFNHTSLLGYTGKLVNVVFNVKPGYFSERIHANYKFDGQILDSDDTTEHVLSIDPNARYFNWYFMLEPESLHVDVSDNPFNIPDKKIVVGTIAAHREVKRIDKIIDAFAQVDHNKFFLLIGGDGPKKPEWERYAQDKLPEHTFKFTGQVLHEDVGKFYNSLDICVVYYAPDGQAGGRCLVASEAAGAGCFLIVSDSGGPKENLLNDFGSILPTKDFDDLLPSAINEYLTFDKNFIHTRKADCRNQYIVRYNNNTAIVKWLESIYNE